jgi:phospholipase D1/2
LKQERQTYTRSGKEEPGFTSSQVPTLEEKTIVEHRPPADAAESEPLADKVDMEKTSDRALPTIAEAENGESSDNASPVNGVQNGKDDQSSSSSSFSKGREQQHRCSGDPCPECGKTSIVKTVEQRAAENNEPDPPQARTADGELYGAPANAAPSDKQDSEVPHNAADTQEDDASDEERKAQDARKLLRKHIAAPITDSVWTVPTPKPKVDKDDFEDPISDAFWKDKWVSAAIHNVSSCLRKI